MRKQPLSSTQFSLSNLLLVVSATGIIIGGFKLLGTRIHENQVSAEIANARLGSILSPIFVPKTATNCGVRGGFYGYSQATFQVDEATFRDFIGNRYLDPGPLDSIPSDVCQSIEYHFKGLGQRRIRESSSGYVIDTMTMRGGWRIVYDSQEQRAYVEHSHR